MDYIEDDFTDALIDAICGEDLSNNDKKLYNNGSNKIRYN